MMYVTRIRWEPGKARRKPTYVRSVPDYYSINDTRLRKIFQTLHRRNLLWNIRSNIVIKFDFEIFHLLIVAVKNISITSSSQATTNIIASHMYRFNVFKSHIRIALLSLEAYLNCILRLIFLKRMINPQYSIILSN